MGVRSPGPAGCIVSGLRGGIGSPGRSGSRLTQCVGISDSGRRYLTVSSLMAPELSPPYIRGHVEGRPERCGRGAHRATRHGLNLAHVEVTVRLFAMLRPRAGASELPLELPEGG